MTIELSPDGYAKIDAQIQAIEDLAQEGVFSFPCEEAPKKCQQIMLEAKTLRQIVLEVMLLVPDTAKAPEGEGNAA
jgi:hypothetical protein